MVAPIVDSEMVKIVPCRVIYRTYNVLRMSIEERTLVVVDNGSE